MKKFFLPPLSENFYERSEDLEDSSLDKWARKAARRENYRERCLKFRDADNVPKNSTKQHASSR